MGMSGGELVLLEIDMERYVNTPDAGMPRPRFGVGAESNSEISVRWKGQLRLVALAWGKPASSVRALETVASFIDIDDAKYQEELAPYFDKAWASAQALPFFQPMPLPEVGMCRYDISCTFIRKEIDTVQTKLWVSVNRPNYPPAEVIFPTSILQKFENTVKMPFSDMEQVNTSSRIEYFKAWRPHSVRIYELNGQRFAIFTMGWGQKRFYNGQKANQWEVPNVSGVERFIEGNDVLFHGQRFDFIQYL